MEAEFQYMMCLFTRHLFCTVCSYGLLCDDVTDDAISLLLNVGAWSRLCKPALGCRAAYCDKMMRAVQGLNRIGNMLVPNENYCKFEEWLMPLLDTMLDEQVGTLPCCLPARAARAQFGGMSLCSRML